MTRLTIENENGLTNQRVAELIGLTYSAISRLRSGDRQPSITTMYAIESVFDWPVVDQLETRVSMSAAAWSQEFDRRIREHSTAS